MLYAQHWPATKGTQAKGPQTTPRRLWRPKFCSCRNKNNCLLPEKCQVKSIANVLPEDGASIYIGLTENTFKKRWSNHCQSFKNEAYETSTELSKLIWRLERDNVKYSIDTQTDPFITVLNLLQVSEKRDIDTEQKKI